MPHNHNLLKPTTALTTLLELGKCAFFAVAEKLDTKAADSINNPLDELPPFRVEAPVQSEDELL